MAEIHVGLEVRPWRAVDAEQAVREQQVREHSRLERALRCTHERPDTRRRTPTATPDRLRVVLEIGRVQLPDAIVLKPRQIADRAGSRLVLDQSHGETEPRLLAAITVVGCPHVPFPPVSATFTRLAYIYH